MTWTKIPQEHHPLFRAALPDDPRVQTLQMFGGVAAKLNGHMFAGLFGRSAMVLLSDADRAAALAMEGAEPFDPMGKGQAHGDKVLLPEAVLHDQEELRLWVGRAFSAAAKLSPKEAKKPANPKKPANK
jgi:TfoX/Sxy family transcriptional regulator of competence genes